jgi:hypothetical protein
MQTGQQGLRLEPPDQREAMNRKHAGFLQFLLRFLSCVRMAAFSTARC